VRKVSSGAIMMRGQESTEDQKAIGSSINDASSEKLGSLETKGSDEREERCECPKNESLNKGGEISERAAIVLNGTLESVVLSPETAASSISAPLRLRGQRNRTIFFGLESSGQSLISANHAFGGIVLHVLCRIVVHGRLSIGGNREDLFRIV